MTTTPYLKLQAQKPRGGFIFLTVQQLCLLWWANRTRLIQLRDFRVWFAAQEMTARRCQIDSGQVPAYTPHELHRLVGGVGGSISGPRCAALKPPGCSPGPAPRSRLPPRLPTCGVSMTWRTSTLCI